MPCCFPSGHLCFCLQCPSLQRISCASLLGWPGATFSQRPGRRVLIVCFSLLYLSVLVLFSGTSHFPRLSEKICSPESSLLSCVCFYHDSPPDCAEVLEGYRVNVLFHAKENFDNAFYRVPWEDELGSGFKKLNSCRRDLIKMFEVTCIRRGLVGSTFSSCLSRN